MLERRLKIYWVIILFLVALLVAFYSKKYQKDDNLVQYIGFAGTITSLVLGVVAIFYSFITNQQSAENSGKLSEAVSKIEKAASDINAISEVIKTSISNIQEGAKTINDVSTSINAKLDGIKEDIIHFAKKDQGELTASPNEIVEGKSVEETVKENLDVADIIEPKLLEDN